MSSATAEMFETETSTQTEEPGYNSAEWSYPTPDPNKPAEELREGSAAVRLSFKWFGTRKALTNEQRNQIASSFEAESDFISAGKKLVNNRHEAVKSLNALRTVIIGYWKHLSLPFPESGIRLIRKNQITAFQERMENYRVELDQAVAHLDEHYPQILIEAQSRLGNLFDPQDYPQEMRGLFAVSWDFPNIEPPSYLMQLRPELYEQERQRVAGQFQEAVRLAEQAFMEEFSQIVNHLCERLEKGEDGKPKTFQASTIKNLNEFVTRFADLNIGNNDDLSRLIQQASDAVRGVGAKTLRTSSDLRATLKEKLQEVSTELDGMMVDRPRRKIIRNAPAQTAPVAENDPLPEEVEIR